MIKVLLVDDEHLALEYLNSIVDWESYGFEVVGGLSDAQQALKIFRKTHPDLVISDVCMYGMDGIDFATAIRDIDQNAHILFLSGYKNFDYIQEAIRLGIDDYLLKSDIDEEIFLHKLVKIKDKIEKEKQKQQYTEGVIFKELFFKNKEEKEYKEIIGETDYIRLHKKYFYLIIAERRVPRFMEQYIPGIINEECYDEKSIREVIMKNADMCDIKCLTTFQINNHEILVVLEIKNNLVSQKEVYEKIYGFSSQVYSELNIIKRNEYNLLFYPKGCAIRQFGVLYRENKEQLNQFYVKKDVQIVELEIEKEREEYSISIKDITSRQIVAELKNGNYQIIKEYLETIMIALEQEDYVTYLWYLKEFMLALKNIEEMVSTLDILDVFSLVESIEKFNLKNPYDVVKYLSYKIEQLKKVYDTKRNKIYSKTIQKAIDYIGENYENEELSANMIAKHVNMSNSYFSTKFKEEIGIGISDYLNNFRIQQAKKLFDENDYMIYEVSEKVGYASSQYFSKIFKQITGFTPNEYKRKNV